MRKMNTQVNMDDSEIPGPDAIEIVITPNLKNRIKELAAIVTKNNLAVVAINNNLPDVIMLKNGMFVPPDPADDCVKVDAMSLNVTANTFFWSGYLKYSGDRWTTSELYIRSLTEGEAA